MTRTDDAQALSGATRSFASQHAAMSVRTITMKETFDMNRFFAKLSAALGLGLALSAPVHAADAFPTKPITIIVSVSPGGSLDTLARMLAASMSTELKQSVVVENVPGAGGLVGFQRLAKSDPNGYTLMFSNNSMVLIPLLYPKANLNVVTDTSAIGTVANVPMVLAVSNKSAIPDLPVMMKRMRAGEFKPNLGSGGPGTSAHLAEAMFLQMTRTHGELVQYRGTGPALTDLMAGTIDGVIDQTVTLMNLHHDKRVKAIAISSPARIAQMPDVPTFSEAGLPQFDLQIWNGLVAPKGTPRPVIDTLAAALNQAIESPEYKERLQQLAAQLPPQAERGPESFRQLLVRDQKRLAEMAQQIGLQPR
ncbi:MULTISPECIES: Bug family tripartite tricarboxylate transporter substrate binding protein [unclassified Cupriavidus]|uniref:Bug family tripartite tricarboxylate transporter substrate binding protein n=1 Tax=Cupriavidus sp. H19C3 TaxID=3241603 RepID=UPI003BF91774